MKTRTHVVILAAIAIVSSGAGRTDDPVPSNIPDIPASVAAMLQPYQNVRSAVFLGWLSRDQGMLVRTRFAETSQIHWIEQPKAMRRQLTFFEDPIGECAVCPDPGNASFLFTKDSAGNEVDQIYYYDLSRGTCTRLSDGKGKYDGVVWSRKGDRFAFRSNRRNERDYDIYVSDVRGRLNFKPLVERGGYWYPVEFSSDDRKLLIKKYISSDESYYYIVDIATRSVTALHDDTAKVAYGTARWSQDTKGIYVVADRFADHKQLLYYDLQTRKFDVLSKQIPWDIEEVEIASSGKTAAFTANEDGMSRLYLMDTGTRSLTRANLPDGRIFGLEFRTKADELAFSLNSATAPSDVYTLNLKSKTFMRWTYSELGGLDASAFIVPKLIQYATFDSVDGKPRMISAYYYEPRKTKGPHPVLIDCHGGPAVQERPSFSYMFQFYLAEMGIAVIAPNIRGSTGYGRAFMMLDDGYKREEAIKDVGCLLDWITKQPQLDRRRIAIIGGSYGGYVALASMAAFSDRLSCGIDALGISNFVTFLENTGKYRQDLRREEYGDERDPEMREFLNRISPLTNAHKIRKPLFVIQGLHDPRVPVSEAEQIVKAVRKSGVNVWYLLAEDEGHGFGKRSNRVYQQQAMVLFLQKYLLK